MSAAMGELTISCDLLSHSISPSQGSAWTIKAWAFMARFNYLSACYALKHLGVSSEQEMRLTWHQSMRRTSTGGDLGFKPNQAALHKVMGWLIRKIEKELVLLGCYPDLRAVQPPNLILWLEPLPKPEAYSLSVSLSLYLTVLLSFPLALSMYV